MRKKFLFWSVMIVFPIVVGLIVYLIFKPSAYVSKLIIDCLGLEEINIQTSNNWFWNYIHYYLCDFLWAFSLTSVVALILDNNRFKAFLSVLICSFVGTIVELMQMWKFISGTFDIVDLVVEFIGSILSIIIVMIYLRRNQNEKKQIL